MRPKIFSFRPNPLADAERHCCRRMTSFASRETGGMNMKRTLIRYRTKPELADTNAALIAAVFAELKTAKPGGVRYLSLRLDDGTFVHFVETADEASGVIPGLPAFKAFQSGIRERCIEPPQFGSATIVGNYRMMDER
jgi:hypothetical protein